MVLRPTVLLSLEQSMVRLTVSVSDCDQGHHDGKTEGGRGQTREGNANMRLVEHTRKSDVLPSIRRMSPGDLISDHWMRTRIPRRTKRTKRVGAPFSAWLRGR